MKNDKSSDDYFTKIVKDIADENLPEIDFDLLTVRLTEASRQLQSASNSVADLELLKSDYQTRISGMVKAMAAVDRKKGALLSALDMIEDLKKLSPADLISCYRTTSARFRDCFPASFGSLSFGTASGTRLKDASDFK